MMYTKLQSAEAAKPVHVYAVFSHAGLCTRYWPSMPEFNINFSLMWEWSWANTFDAVAGSTQVTHSQYVRLEEDTVFPA